MGNLYIVSTPIGNLNDITLRALKVLFSVKYIACEDTRKTGLLIKNYESRIRNQELFIKDIEITTKPHLISYYDEIENIKSYEILRLLEEGNDVALVSDSGTPLVSDPGYKLVRECRKRAVNIIPVPGPSAILAALVSAGLPTNNFVFLGYLPENKNKRRKLLIQYSKIDATLVFFESPLKLKKTIKDLQEILGNIEISVSRELTKIHEEAFRGSLTECLTHFTAPKGEFVLLFNPKMPVMV